MLPHICGAWGLVLGGQKKARGLHTALAGDVALHEHRRVLCPCPRPMELSPRRTEAVRPSLQTPLRTVSGH